jgi:hypothetical protein
MKNLYGRNGARHWLSLREGLIVASAIAAAATAQPAHAETLTMICGGYSVAFSPGNLTSHAPKKDRNYPITKVDRQNLRTVVSGETQYGKITAFFSKDGHSSIVWTNGKDVVLNPCASETVLATQPPLQERRSAKPDPEDGDMLRNRPPIPMPKAPKQEEKNTDQLLFSWSGAGDQTPPIPMPKAPKQEEKNTDQLLFSWSGAGDKTTRPFIVDGPWEIQWSRDNIYIRVLHADGTLVSSNLGKGSGSAYQPTGGSHYLQISAGEGNWTVKIAAIAKQEVDMPPTHQNIERHLSWRLGKCRQLKKPLLTSSTAPKNNILRARQISKREQLDHPALSKSAPPLMVKPPTGLARLLSSRLTAMAMGCSRLRSRTESM